MRLLFVYSGKVKIDSEGRYYTGGSYPWQRYVSLADELTIVMRRDPQRYGGEEAMSRFKPIDTGRIRCLLTPVLTGSLADYLNIRKRLGIRKTIRNAVRDHDRVIARVPSANGYIAVACARRYKKPCLVEVVGDPWDTLWNHSLRGKVLAPFAWLRLRRCMAGASHGLYVSRRFLQRRYPTRGAQVGCPDVVLDPPGTDVLENRLQRISRQRSDHAVLGLIGSCSVGYRGHGTLIRAAAELKSRGIVCELRFLGGGDGGRWTAMAREYGVAGQLVFSGILPSGPPVYRWIDDLDILTMPTRQETLGRAIIEAMSRGCPVIGSLETAIGEQVGSDCLCAAGDYRALADLVERMITDRDYMSYCAYENFYRSFKYTNGQTDRVRERFYRRFMDCAGNSRTGSCPGPAKYAYEKRD